MIYFTGDTHAEFFRFDNGWCPVQRGDTVIICGDFGGVWADTPRHTWWLNWLAEKPYTICFADGNHENMDMLDAYPVDEWNGGKVHFIRPNVIHLMRGQIYTIENRSFFVMGGAQSHDIQDGILDPTDPQFKAKYQKLKRRNAFFRVKGVSWWEREMPSPNEYAEAEANLERVGRKVDYVISHCAPNFAQDIISQGQMQHDELTDWLDTIVKTVTFRFWFFGHYHINRPVSSNMMALYKSIVSMETVEAAFACGPDEQKDDTDAAHTGK